LSSQQQSLNIISATLQLQFSSSSSSSKRAQPCELQSWSVFTDNWHGNGSEELTRWQDKQSGAAKCCNIDACRARDENENVSNWNYL